MYPNQNFDYHEYRNIDSDKFIKAAKKLSERGYYVLEWEEFKKKFLKEMTQK